LYGHDTQSTEAIVGVVPPDGWQATGQGLFARGHIDVTSAVGRLHRMLRTNALSWSIGFSVTRSTPPRNGQVRVLEQVGTMHELSIVPIAANPRTATLTLKGAGSSHDELHARLVAAGVLSQSLEADSYDWMRREFGERAHQSKSTAPIQVATFDY
jgi:hypothetical protein